MASQHDEEVLGKAYDSRLMKRLLRYLRPYKWQVGIALLSIVLKAIADVLGPALTHGGGGPVPGPGAWNSLAAWAMAESQPADRHRADRRHLCRPDALQLSARILQTYIMQWAGQKVMFDLRSEIFRHLQQLHIGFYDKNPVGRLVTRVTSDVDALNEMFTAGVVSIFEDIFVLAGILAIMLKVNWRLALITFAVLALHLLRHQSVSRQGAR